MTTKVHNTADTSFAAAATLCSQRGANLCSKSQYVILNDNDLFDEDLPRWTSEQSDNDEGRFDAVIGATGDNPQWNDHFAYACCASQRSVDKSCPGSELGGVCTLAIHDPAVGDKNFYESARECAALGADLCSKSQMQTLRNLGAVTGEAWTNDGADNDSGSTGGLLSSQSDNPDPENTLMGYVCCH